KSFLRTVPFSLRRKTLTRLNYLFNSFLPTEKYPFETILSSPAVGLKGHPFKKKILYYIGCATSIMDHMTGKAVLNVLHYTGVKVIMPDYQVCCGRPALAWGDIQTARNLCEKNYRLFSRIQVDAILTDCSSCRQTLKESVYKLFDKSHPFYSEMVSLSKKVYEVTEFIVTLGMAMVPNSRFQHITYHVPCHIQGDKHIETAPLKLQSKNKNLKITEMDQPNRCCGSAGIYYLKNPSIAAKLKIRKVQEIQKTHAKTVISQCPSCRFYLKQALTPEYEILHPISLFNRKE
ncbi:MAG: (Fe-S)-binding protein, partial [Desulfobacteraceae bacterium]